MDSSLQKLRDLTAEYNEAAAKNRLQAKQRRASELEQQMSENGFWNHPEASSLAKEQADITRQLEPWLAIKRDLGDLDGLLSTGDASLQKELDTQLQNLADRLNGLKKELRFAGPYDERDVILSIFAGAGGTDAQDWAQMLLRMYTRWAEREGLKVKTIEQSAGEEAGLKSVSIEINGGQNLYGKLAGEHGVHRLVRLSPYNADQKRQTSFAKVEVLPLIDKPQDLEIDDKDIKVDVFRSAGAGGQSVNTTDSAVRVTHLPTGIAVAIQNERSQLQNKETALAVLRSKLIALKLEQHAKDLADIKGPNQSAEWGNQIRSYVLHPYKQVKDLRTGFETAGAEKVLDGDLNGIMDAWLDNSGQV